MEQRKKSIKVKRGEQQRKIRDKWEDNKKKWGRNKASASECNRLSQLQSLHGNGATTRNLQPPRVWRDWRGACHREELKEPHLLKQRRCGLTEKSWLSQKKYQRNSILIDINDHFWIELVSMVIGKGNFIASQVASKKFSSDFSLNCFSLEKGPMSEDSGTC